MNGTLDLQTVQRLSALETKVVVLESRMDAKMIMLQTLHNEIMKMTGSLQVIKFVMISTFVMITIMAAIVFKQPDIVKMLLSMLFKL